MSQKKGAPFDIDNIFNIPAIDGGEIISNENIPFSSIDGGTFLSAPSRYIDGGSLPSKGTATYDPNQIYGPNSPNLLKE